MRFLTILLIFFSQLSFLGSAQAKALELADGYGKTAAIHSQGKQLPLAEDVTQEIEEEDSHNPLPPDVAEILSIIIFMIDDDRKILQQVNHLNLQKLDCSLFSLHSTLRI